MYLNSWPVTCNDQAWQWHMITVLFVEDWGFKAEINPQMYTFWSYRYKFRFKPCFLFFLNWAFYWQWRTNKYSLYQNKVLEQLCRKEFPDGVAQTRTRGATWALCHSHAVHGFRILKLCFGFLWKCVKTVRKKIHVVDSHFRLYPHLCCHFVSRGISDLIPNSSATLLG